MWISKKERRHGEEKGEGERKKGVMIISSIMSTGEVILLNGPPKQFQFHR